VLAGFEVVIVNGPTPDALEAALTGFLDAMDDNTIAVFYWAAYFAHAFDARSQRVVNYCLVSKPKPKLHCCCCCTLLPPHHLSAGLTPCPPPHVSCASLWLCAGGA
jgi:hypothetical protein